VQYGLSDAATKSWFEASFACDERDATLASFHNEDEVMAVINHIGDSSSHNLFIGLSSNGFGNVCFIAKSCVAFVFVDIIL